MAVMLFAVLSSVVVTAAAAGTVDKPAPTTDAGSQAVQTRAQVASISREDRGRQIYIRLKLLPPWKLPFSTLTFRVPEPGMIASVREGSSVEFTAERINGENTLKSIREVAPCVRFQKCPL